MKQSISSVWLLGIIIVFILIFACYITITINYTASFKLKNEVLTIIQKHHGMTYNKGKQVNSIVRSGNKVTGEVGAFQTINLYLRGNHYTAEGSCPNDGMIWYGVYDLYKDNLGASANYEKAAKGKKYYYCFSKYGTGSEKIKYNTIYYKVRLFYKFEIPVLTEFLSVKVEGMTDEIFAPADTGNNVKSEIKKNDDFFKK